MKNKILITILIIILIVVGVSFLKPWNDEENGFDKSNPYKTSPNLSMNLDKTYYKPGEQVDIRIATDCEEKLELFVNPPPSVEGTEGSIPIEKSPYCYAIYKPEKTGEYKLTLSDGSDIAEAGFVVSDEINAFEISRWGSNSINKDQTDRSVMKITVTSNEDFSGELIETLPESVEIVWLGVAKQQGNKLTWNVDMKAGDSQEFNYEYTVGAIHESPNSQITLGPARLCHSELVSGSKCIFEENRIWQIQVSSR